MNDAPFMPRLRSRLLEILAARRGMVPRQIAPEGRVPRPTPKTPPANMENRIRRNRLRWKMQDEELEGLGEAVAAGQPWYTAIFSQVGDMAGKFLSGKAQLELAKTQAKNQADLQAYQMRQQMAAWDPTMTGGAILSMDAQRRFEAEQRALAYDRITGATTPGLSTGTMLAVAGVGIVAILMMNKNR